MSKFPCQTMRTELPARPRRQAAVEDAVPSALPEAASPQPATIFTFADFDPESLGIRLFRPFAYNRPRALRPAKASLSQARWTALNHNLSTAAFALFHVNTIAIMLMFRYRNVWLAAKAWKAFTKADVGLVRLFGIGG